MVRSIGSEVSPELGFRENFEVQEPPPQSISPASRSPQSHSGRWRESHSARSLDVSSIRQEKELINCIGNLNAEMMEKPCEVKNNSSPPLIVYTRRKAKFAVFEESRTKALPSNLKEKVLDKAECSFFICQYDSSCSKGIQKIIF